jgi:hypothetical protein
VAVLTGKFSPGAAHTAQICIRLGYLGHGRMLIQTSTEALYLKREMKFRGSTLRSLRKTMPPCSSSRNLASRPSNPSLRACGPGSGPTECWSILYPVAAASTVCAVCASPAVGGVGSVGSTYVPLRTHRLAANRSIWTAKPPALRAHNRTSPTLHRP